MTSPETTPWRLTLDAVAHYPRPGTNVPGRTAFSPDSRLLTYLFSDGGDLVRSLWALDTETGDRRVLAHPPDGGTTDENANPEEALRRERQRVREGGITHYSWAKSADRLLVPINGQLYVTSSAGGALRRVAARDEPAVDARLSADGRRAVFVSGGELWVVDLESDHVRRLTFDAAGTVVNGLAEFIAQEEMGRAAGFWVSPDGARVAYTQVDEGHIPVYPIVHQGETWRVEEHRYPFAGGPNAHVRLGVVDVAGGPTTWLDLGGEVDIYLARVEWTPDAKLAIQFESRDQRALELWLYDATSAELPGPPLPRTLLLREDVHPWVNLHNDLRFLEDGTVLWSSERSGFRHLYLYGRDGSVLRQLTHGEWPVDHVVHVDETRRAVWFLSGGGLPTERHLYRVSLDGGEPQRMTDDAGFHGATFAADGSRYVHTFDSLESPPTLDVHFADDTWRIPLHPALGREAVAPGLSPPEVVELTSRDGVRLFGAIYHPTSASSEAERAAIAPGPVVSTNGGASSTRSPLVVAVYGGPHWQTVTNSWSLTVDLRAQWLASLGFTVFKLDNRGSARRGLAFEGALSRAMGTVEVRDQVDGVRWLVDAGLVDPDRVGIYGWSYGGYMTLMTLLTAPEVFKVGVAGAPVANWDGYDTHYTERYMGTPANNAEGYRQGSATAHAANLAGRLLLVHGMVDENVHFRHTARLIAALEAADRPFELLAFPAERHMPRDEQGRRYLESRVVDFFRTHLGG